MVQVLPQVAKKPNPFNRGLEMAMQLAGNYQQKGQQEEAAKKLGLDPSVFSLPEQAQAEYFKNAFATEKGPTPLQESQMKLNEEKLNALKGRQQLFQRLSSGQEGQVQAGTEKGQDALSSMSENNLSQLAAFAGQPGEEGIIGNIAKAEVERREKQSKIEREQEKESPEYIRGNQLATSQANADLKYQTELNERRSKQILKKESLNRLENMSKKDVTGKAYEKFLENLGLTALTSSGRREYSAEAKNQFTDFKSIVGSQMSASEFMVLSGAYPNADFTPEANKAIINNLKQIHDTLDYEYDVARQLKKDNKGKIPLDYQEKVNEKVQEYVAQKIDKIKENIRTVQNEQYGIPKGFTLMFDPEGEPLSVPDSPEEISKYEELGATLP